ncbi:class I adenylate-forming enzyme family protein [Mycobacterium intracellulare]|uniref:class I adenylate-forming enzyme family protein n=1 Tax=Mycobacterium intracellulare TaxID=1767 RepID=UPI001EED4E26|nr:class I adenylate-forming enzyme family protein [Mycobacterium intracellulare]MEE3754981.1 class I adenylate-forming enzyme family protein [Mycobacterium intracellulare]
MLRRQARVAADTSVTVVDTTVGELLSARAASHPNREALVGVGHDGNPVRLTYGDLYEESRRVATALSAITVPGDYVAIWAPNVAEWPLVQYGAALAGVVLVALNPMLSESELRYALTHCRATVLVHADTVRDRSTADVARQVDADMPGLHRISLSERTRWCADEVDDSLLYRRARPDADRPAMLQYTSGTTGRPKGVLLSHRAIVNVAKLTMEAVDAAHGARFLNPLPMFHTAGCVVSTLGPLWSAGTVVLVDRFSPDPVLDSLARERVEVLFYVPAILSALVTVQRSRRSAAPQLRLVLGGAARVTPELILAAESCFGGTVLNLFGQTELAPVLTLTRPHDARHDRLTTVGRPLPQVECKIVDADGHVAEVNTVGEICARGYQQFLEYLHDSEATAAALDNEGFVRTGDLGMIDERGYLTVTGRLKELVIRGGENVSPTEVERLIDRDPRVDEAVVLGLPDERLGEIVAAVIRTRSPSRQLKDELIDHLWAHASPHKIPERWFVADDFPCTATGKVRRFALRDSVLRGELTEL